MSHLEAYGLGRGKARVGYTFGSMCFSVPLSLLLHSLLVLSGVARDTLFVPVDLAFVFYVCVDLFN